MKPAPSDQVTVLLRQLSEGRAQAGDELLPLLYEELRELARRYMRRERSDHTLQPTALVHEAYLRLVDQRDVAWRSRAHFLGIAAQAMRRVLVDHARRHRAGKRGGGHRITLVDALESEGSHAGAPAASVVDLVAMDQALERLGELDPRALRVVELRYFAGLDVAEAAEVLNLSPATVKRDWRDARTWLRRELELAPAEGEAR
jgi:RNA polymerase sigma-70 factor, ECF subfamily